MQLGHLRLRTASSACIELEAKNALQRKHVTIHILYTSDVAICNAPQLVFNVCKGQRGGGHTRDGSELVATGWTVSCRLEQASPVVWMSIDPVKEMTK